MLTQITVCTVIILHLLFGMNFDMKSHLPITMKKKTEQKPQSTVHNISYFGKIVLSCVNGDDGGGGNGSTLCVGHE